MLHIKEKHTKLGRYRYETDWSLKSDMILKSEWKKKNMRFRIYILHVLFNLEEGARRFSRGHHKKNG